MDTTLITLAIAIIGSIFGVASFVTSRKDKAVKDGKENGANQRLLEYRLDELTKKVDQILTKLDKYDEEIEEKVDKAIAVHIKEYHKQVKTSKSKGV